MKYVNLKDFFIITVFFIVLYVMSIIIAEKNAKIEIQKDTIRYYQKELYNLRLECG